MISDITNACTSLLSRLMCVFVPFQLLVSYSGMCVCVCVCVFVCASYLLLTFMVVSVCVWRCVHVRAHASVCVYAFLVCVDMSYVPVCVSASYILGYIICVEASHLNKRILQSRAGQTPLCTRL